MRKLSLALIISLFGWSVIAQQKLPEQYLDSIKGTFDKYAVAQKADKKWLKELLNSELFAEMESDIERISYQDEVDFYIPKDTLVKRLAELNAKSAFQIEYSESLANVIKNFVKNRSKSYERLMALSEYYFPLFEEKLAKHNLPMELKYLAIVESALNPKARSRVGATGLWQFMYPTGKQYGLDVNTFVDERSDPIKSTEAAAQYLSELYDLYGNWELALASYNYGPGNVSKAIRRSGGKTNYWEIRQYMPRETQGYVPAFLATMYIYEYHKEHNIIPMRANIPYIQTDTVMVKESMRFDAIAKLLDMPTEEIQLLNPAYKSDVIPYYQGKQFSLRLPLDKIAVFTANESKIYDYLAYEKNFHKQSPIEEIAKESKAIASNSSNRFHTIRRGESLGKIAQKYGMSVAQLKQLNGLRGNTIVAGRKLKVSGTQMASNTQYYTVRRGDTLSSIAKRHRNVTVAQLMKNNNIKNANAIRPGMKLKI